MSPEQSEQFVSLLYWYAETELDQWDNWRLDTAVGPVYVSMSMALLPAWSDLNFVPLPKQPRTSWRTGRFADVDRDRARQAASQQDALTVIAQMRADLADRGSREWENPTLDRFLDALEAVIDAMPGPLGELSETEPGPAAWRLLARALVAATGYE